MAKADKVTVRTLLMRLKRSGHVESQQRGKRVTYWRVVQKSSEGGTIPVDVEQ